MTEVKPTAPQKFQVPAEWKARCDMVRLSSQNRLEFIPLHDDFLKCFLTASSIEFLCYFAVGWELYEFMKPKEFTPELVKEMLNSHKQFPNSTRICVKKNDYGRYEKLVAEYLRKKFEDAAAGGAMAHQQAYKVYMDLSMANQAIFRGMIDRECYLRVASAASSSVMNMCSSRDAIRFLVEIVGREPSLYDHGAVTALVASAITWNVLKLPKRESKLTVQSAILHDIERHCAYIGKPANSTQISSNAIKEISVLSNAKEAFHEANILVMEQFRERIDGTGYPKGKKGREENDPMAGINRMSRVVSIGCAFSEYMLKRKDKKPLELQTIQEMLLERAQNGELDKAILTALFDDLKSGQVRRPGAAEASGDEDDDF